MNSIKSEDVKFPNRAIGAKITGINERTGKPQITTYGEEKINKTLYCVTSIFNADIDFGKAMEDLIIRKILRTQNTSQTTKTHALKFSDNGVT